MIRVTLTALMIVCGVLGGSAYAGHWGGCDSCNHGCRSCANIWDGYYSERGHGFCSWCAHPYGNYADCDSCGCEEGEPMNPTEIAPPMPAKPAASASLRRYESWPKATALFPAGWPR